MYYLLVGKLPFYSKEKVQIIKDIYNGNLNFTSPNFISLSKNAQDLIKNLLKVDPKKRFSAMDALKHNWLQQFTKDNFLTFDTLNKLRFFRVRHK